MTLSVQPAVAIFDTARGEACGVALNDAGQMVDAAGTVGGVPIYQAQCSLASGGTTTGGTLYDLMHVKTAGASGQSATIG